MNDLDLHGFGFDEDGQPLDLVDIMSDPWGSISGWDAEMRSLEDD